MTRLRHHIQSLRGTTTVVVACALLLWAVGVERTRHNAGGPFIEGTYDVEVGGCGAGKGTCDVQLKVVKVDCRMVDDTGMAMRLKSNNLKRDKNRFYGDAALDGVHAKIAGRVDPPNAAFQKPHLTATFLADDGRAGRVVGSH